MQNHESVTCPYCGQENTIPIDTSVTQQRFITDCEVCCRPFELIIECEAGEIVSIDAQGE